MGADRLTDFLACGFQARWFFRHRIRHVPRPGSDGQVLADSMYGVTDPGMPWSDREAAALRTVTGHPTTTFGVHDCYAHLWLDHYDELVAKLSGMARLRTIGQVADELFLCAAE